MTENHSAGFLFDGREFPARLLLGKRRTGFCEFKMMLLLKEGNFQVKNFCRERTPGGTGGTPEGCSRSHQSGKRRDPAQVLGKHCMHEGGIVLWVIL